MVLASLSNKVKVCRGEFLVWDEFKWGEGTTQKQLFHHLAETCTFRMLYEYVSSDLLVSTKKKEDAQ